MEEIAVTHSLTESLQAIFFRSTSYMHTKINSLLHEQHRIIKERYKNLFMTQNNDVLFTILRDLYAHII
jgi:hypothetical protein